MIHYSPQPRSRQSIHAAFQTGKAIPHTSEYKSSYGSRVQTSQQQWDDQLMRDNLTHEKSNLTSFQNYLISQNIPSMTKQETRGDDMMEQMINPEYVSFNNHQLPKRTNQNFGSYREQPSLQKKQPVVPTLNLPQNDLYSQNLSRSSSKQKLSINLDNDFKMPNQSTFPSSQLHKFDTPAGFSPDYLRIIQEIEQNKYRQPQWRPSLPAYSQSTVNRHNRVVQRSLSSYQGNKPSTYNTQADNHVNFLEGLYHNQIVQQRQMQPSQSLEQLYNLENQKVKHQQIQQQLQQYQGQRHQQKQSVSNLLQYYQQKFNILQHQPNCYGLDGPTISNPGFAAQQRSQSANHFATQQYLQQPMYCSNPGYLANSTPQNVQIYNRNKASPNISDAQRPWTAQQISQSKNAQTNLDDLCQVLNKKVLHDFESKSLSQIAQLVKNYTPPSTLQANLFSRPVHTNKPVQMTKTNNIHTLHQAATRVQKYLKGYSIRKHFNELARQYYFFKRAGKKLLVKDLVEDLKGAYLQMKQIKAALLKNYVNHCAVKIQKVFKGHYARTVTVKIKRVFKTIDEKFSATVVAWRIRHIMKTKEIENFILQIKDFQKAMSDMEGDATTSEQGKQLKAGLETSRYNTTLKMLGLIAKMQINGLWLMYKQLEKRERKDSFNVVPSTSLIQNEVIKVNRNKKSFQQAAMVGSNNNLNLNQKPAGRHSLASKRPPSSSLLSMGIDRTQDTNSNYQSFLEIPNHSYYSPVKNSHANSGIKEQQSRRRNELSAGRNTKAFSLGSSKFQPNFASEAYKEQAKEQFQRRMHYNPREQVNQSREHSNSNHSSPAKPVPQKTSKRVEEANSLININNKRQDISQDQQRPSQEQFQQYQSHLPKREETKQQSYLPKSMVDVKSNASKTPRTQHQNLTVENNRRTREARKGKKVEETTPRRMREDAREEVDPAIQMFDNQDSQSKKSWNPFKRRHQ